MKFSSLLFFLLMMSLPSNTHYLSQEEFCKNKTDNEDAYETCLIEFKKEVEVCLPEPINKCFYREHVIHQHQEDLSNEESEY